MKLTLLIISLVLLISCKQKEASFNELISLDSLESEEQKITLITDTSQIKWFIENYNSSWRPTRLHMQIIDSIILSAISENSKSFYRRLKPDSLNAYYKQFICYTTKEGDSLVFINALCHIHNYPITDSNDIIIEMRRADWQHNIIEVMDGGDCFWQISIDIRKKKYLSLNVNGLA